MAEQTEKQPEEKVDKKTDSRKFVVWLTCLIVALIVIALCVVAIIVTKVMNDGMISLAGKALDYFFIISMIYLGVNVGQKIGFAFADVLLKKYNTKEADGE